MTLMNVREVERVVAAQPTLGGAGVRLQRTVGTRTLDYLDPFLLLDHFGSHRPDDYLAGFPWHPHRGIETVTYMLAGEVDHRDSIGNQGRIGPGDVQWMTAGGGIMHEEMPRPGRDGRMAGFQLWVNLPASHKMTRPRYQDVPAATIPRVDAGDGATVAVVAGEYAGARGPVGDIVADPEYLDVALPAEALVEQPVPRDHTSFAYVYEGRVALGAVADEAAPSAAIDGPALAVLGHGDLVRARAAGRPARLLLVAGRPLGEPIARYGPFVMTTREEIDLALRDLRADSFVWRDDAEWARLRQTWRRA